MANQTEKSDPRILDTLQSPSDLKALPVKDLSQLAQEIRDEIIHVTSLNGGHIGPNLGVVELTLALHRTFETPEDKFIFDVAHQGYVHKLLTGRQGRKFRNIRKTDGFSGFLYRRESEHDAWGAGHAGTALSAALGMATARDRLGTDEHVVAVIGDAALTCGITMEALNNIAASTRRLIVILNDNERSIDKNVGAMAAYLTELITNSVYNHINTDLEHFLKRVPGGNSLIRMGSKTKRSAKNILVPSCIFENYGLRYVGPIDGHDLDLLHKSLQFAKNADGPILLHVLTKKGKGYEAAISQPEKFHGTSPFDIATGKGKAKKGTSPPNYQDVFGQALVRFAKEDKKIVGITGAMPSGTGLSFLRDELPNQYFDVGIAEEHAVLFAGGMAARGLHPVCAIYSTFLQRAYDPIIHDICLQDLPVTFAMDRAGLSPNDGPTHHGVFDIAYLRCIPNTIVMQPKDEDELVDMFHTSLNTPRPMFIRYPRGAAQGVVIKDTPEIIPIGQAEVLKEGSDIIIWALGSMVQDALLLASELEDEKEISVGVVNARFAKPIDQELLLKQAVGASLFVTMEDHAVTGGFGTGVLEVLQEANQLLPVERIGWPDVFVEHGTSAEILREANGLSPEAILNRVLQRWESLAPFETRL
ncbi:MAG: 1-deoxy-D-xylulose-5-phosphate synthase [Opitutales bacterium]